MSIRISDQGPPSGASVAAPAVVPQPKNDSLVTTFQPAHGWTVLAGVTIADDTTDFVLGSQSLKATTTPATAGSFENTALSVDATGKAFRIWVKFDAPESMTEFNFYAGDATFANFYLWTVQAAEAGDSQRFFRPGEWTAITLSVADATVTGTPPRGALTRMRIRIKDDGTSRVARFNGVGLVAEQTAFTSGVVSVTFDDVYDSQYAIGRKVLDQYGFPATCYTIAGNVGDAGYMTLAQLKQLQAVNGWEIAGHAYTDATHTARYTNLTSAERTADARAMRDWLIDNGFTGFDHMAYPGGEFDVATIDDLDAHFATARTVWRRMKHETVPPADPMKLRSVSVSATDTPASITAMIDAAAANDTWLILTFHTLVASGATGAAYNEADFDTIVDHLKTSGVAVRTVGDVIRAA